MKRFAVCILATMLMLGALPMLGANAAAAVTGQITGLNCSTGQMVIMYSTRGDTMHVRINSSTAITVNGAISSCDELAVGMTATASGNIEDGVLVATFISATGTQQEKTFRLNAKITSLGCPNSITGSTQYGTITFDISQASVTKDGRAIGCSELAIGDMALIAGKVVSGNYVADSVSATTPSTEVTIQGTIQSVACPEITVSASGQTYTVNLGSATITINGKASSCQSLASGMIVAISATKNGNTLTAKIVTAKTQNKPFSLSGTIVTISCSAGQMMLSTSQGTVPVIIKSARIFKDGKEIFCESLTVGDEVSISGETDGNEYTAQTITVTQSGPKQFNITGKISKIECPFITVTTALGDIRMTVAGAEIKINNAYSSCTDLLAGDTASVTGLVQGVNYTAKTVSVSRSTDPNPPTPPTPPTPPEPTPPDTKIVTGKVLQTNCTNKLVLVETSNGQITVPLQIQFYRDGAIATCNDIKVGDAIKVTLTVNGNTSTISKIEFFSSGTTPSPTETTFDAEIVSINCNSKLIMVRKSDGTGLSLPMDPACVFLKNGAAIQCSDLVPFMIVTVTARIETTSGAMTVTKIVVKNPLAPGLDTYTGTITAIDCTLQKLKVRIGEADIDVVIAGAAITVNSNISTCQSLAVGMKVVIVGKISNYVITATKVDATAAESSDCNGPFSITGTVFLLDCTNKIISVKVGSIYITMRITESTLFLVNSLASDCTGIAKDDIVEISGTCTTETGMVAQTINRKTSTDPGTSNTYEGTILSITCGSGNLFVRGYDGLSVLFKLYNTTEFYLNGNKVTCSALIAGMHVKVTYKVDIATGNKIAIKVEATIDNSGGGGGGGGGTPPTPPPGTGGGGSGGGGETTPPPESGSGSGGSIKAGDPYQSVVTVESFECSTGTVKGTDEYNSGKKITVNLTSSASFFYKQEKVECGKVKPGYMVKVIGKYASDTSKVDADSIEILPVSPVKFSVFGRIIDINGSTGDIKLEKITNTQSNGPVIQSVTSPLSAEVFSVKIDPSTTFDYRGEKLTVKDLRVGIIMNVEGLLDPVNNSMSTNNFALSARQATAVTQTGTVADVYCDKNLFWIETNGSPDVRYILIRMSAQTEITVNGTKATCADITKGSSITVNGKLDPFDLFVSADTITSQFDKENSSTFEGEVVSVDTSRSFFWVKVDDAQGIRYIQVKFTADTKIIVFGKIGTASDLSSVGMVSVTGLAQAGNPFIFNAGTVETTGKIVENLTATGTVVFTDCTSKVLFVKTSAGVERFELTTSTKLTSGDKISACTDLKEGMTVTLTYDKKGTKTVVTKIIMPPPKTIIKLTIGLGAMSVNGKNQLIDAPPYIKDGSTMVPLRVVTEAFGASLTWNQSDKRITLQKGSKIIICWIGRTDALVGGLTTPMKQAPEQDKSGRTMVPIRFMSELFGAEVLWDQDSKTITITM